MLRHMDFMKGLKRYTIWYCQYGDDRAKPTDIWTNSKTWRPLHVCKNYKYDNDGNIINRHCHHESAQRSGTVKRLRAKGIEVVIGGTQGRKNSYDRSKIPEELCNEIINSIKP